MKNNPIFYEINNTGAFNLKLVYVTITYPVKLQYEFIKDYDYID